MAVSRSGGLAVAIAVIAAGAVVVVLRTGGTTEVPALTVPVSSDVEVVVASTTTTASADASLALCVVDLVSERGIRGVS